MFMVQKEFLKIKESIDGSTIWSPNLKGLNSPKLLKEVIKY